ncbi:hypothetical protein [Brevundimonas sp. M-11_2]
MRSIVIVAAVVLGLAGQAQAQTGLNPDVTVLPEVTVSGRPTPQTVRDFVGRVAAPSSGRGLARWRGEVCPGVANLDREAAQAIIDRITTAATNLDLRTGQPGCKPNLVVVFTEDGGGVARALNDANPRLFRQNVTGLDRGAAAFRDFLNADRPVRWWSLSLPVDSETGLRAVRIPGDLSGGRVDSDIAAMLYCNPDDCAIGAAPVIRRKGAGRLNTQIVDDLFKTIVIVDLNLIGEVNTVQLGDYIAFIGLAQLDAQAETQGFDTVLNLFSGGGQQGLTEWDRSYLSAIYAARPSRISPRAQASAVAAIMTGDVRAARSDDTP